MQLTQFRAKPFHLDDRALGWVEQTFARLSIDEKLWQIVLPLCRDLTRAGLEHMLKFKCGGVHRMSLWPTVGCGR